MKKTIILVSGLLMTLATLSVQAQTATKYDPPAGTTSVVGLTTEWLLASWEHNTPTNPYDEYPWYVGDGTASSCGYSSVHDNMYMAHSWGYDMDCATNPNNTGINTSARCIKLTANGDYVQNQTSAQANLYFFEGTGGGYPIHHLDLTEWDGVKMDVYCETGNFQSLVLIFYHSKAVYDRWGVAGVEECGRITLTQSTTPKCPIIPQNEWGTIELPFSIKSTATGKSAYWDKIPYIRLIPNDRSAKPMAVYMDNIRLYKSNGGTAIIQPDANDVVVSLRYYNLQGAEITQPAENGIYIVNKLFASGKTVVTKEFAIK